jgi:hypothetical protein
LGCQQNTGWVSVFDMIEIQLWTKMLIYNDITLECEQIACTG